jgi:hypothetical protein
MHYDFNLKCCLPDGDDFSNMTVKMAVKSFLLSLVICIAVLALCFGCYEFVDYYKHPTVDITGNNDKEVVYYNGRPISVHRDINDY